jgi:LuxR family maltose regulon positive regulatory protein
MLENITYSVFLQPHRRSTLITRSRLNHWLAQLLQNRLTLLIAPAGYGKTSLLIDFAQDLAGPICWYTIDSGHNDLVRFLENVLAVLNYRYRDFGLMPLSFIHDVFLPEVGIERVVTILVNEILEKIKGPLYFFLDNFYLVDDNPEICRFVSLFIQNLGDNCHFLIASRRQPLLSDLELMTSHSQVGVMGSDALAFQPEEIQQFALQNYRYALKLDEAKQIAQYTDGWITGLILTSDSLFHQAGAHPIAKKMTSSGLDTYLKKQILDPLPLEQRKLVLRTSVFQNFNVGLCAAVLGRTVYPEAMDWQTLIDSIVQKNLFVLTYFQDEVSFRYTHFFREFLQHRMDEELPDEKALLLNRLAEVNFDLGSYDEAFQALSQIGDDLGIMRLIEKIGPHLLKEGQHYLLINWIEQLPHSYMEGNPYLLSLKGAARILGKEGEMAISLLDQAVRAFRISADQLGLAQTLVRRCTAHQFMGDHQKAMLDANEALLILKNFPDDQFSRAEALGIRGVALYDIGKTDEALESLSQAKDIFQSLEDESRLAGILLDIGMVYRGRGEISSSEEMYLQAQTYLQSAKDQTRLANVYNNLGRFLLQQGNYPEASKRFNQAMECAHQIGYSRLEAFVLFSFGELYAELESFEASRHLYMLSRQIATRLKHQPLIFSIDLAEADIALKTNNLQWALHILHNMELYVSGSGSIQEMSFFQFISGKIALASGLYDEALESFDQALIGFQTTKRKYDAARVLFYKADTYYQLNLLDQALGYLGQALSESDPEFENRTLVITGSEGVKFLQFAQKNPVFEESVTSLLNQIRKFHQAIPLNRRLVRERARAIPLTEPQIQVWGFGEPEVRIHNQHIQLADWQSSEQLEMLFYFLLHPEGVTRSRLEDDFWPEKLRTNDLFKNAIYRLRSILGNETIVYEHGTYTFNWGLDYACDFEEFSSRYAYCEKDISQEEKLIEYQRMIELYRRGAFFQAPAGTWMDTARELYRRRYIVAAYALAYNGLNRQEYSLALDYILGILKADEYQEEAYRLGMIANSGIGDRKEIERLYRAYVHVFKDHYQIKPSDTTRQLYEQLIQ